MAEDKSIKTGPAKGSAPHKLRPTIIGPVVKKTTPPVRRQGPGTIPTSVPASDPTQSAAKLRRRNVPTAIPGVERRRLKVDIEDLKRLFPLATANVLGEAIGLLNAFVLESANDRTAVLWGHAKQQDYSDMVSRSLQLSQDQILVKAAGYINRMTTILSSIDLEAVAAAQPSGGFGQYLKRLNNRIDIPDELEAARLELDHLVRLMGASLQPLLDLKQALENLAQRTEELGDEVEAASLAAEFLSRLLNADRPALAQRFIDRSMSLAQTVAQIRSSDTLRQAQIEQPLQLIASIQNVALVMIPAWLGSIAALTAAMRRAKRLTPTETGELAYQLRTIIKQLKA